MTILFSTDNKNFFIAGISTSGSHHYSEPLSLEEVFYQIEKYDSTIEYFGGGIINVYYNSELIYSYSI